VELPPLQPPNEPRDKWGDDFGDFAVDLYEWLSLVSLGSPRVELNDKIDPFLSRYRPPKSELLDPQVSQLVKISWEGFLSPSWTHQTLVQILLAASIKTWFSMSISSFNESLSAGSKDCTILKLPSTGNEYILWEVEEG
jgi:ribonuclease P/MRP protein subunit RPP40